MMVMVVPTTHHTGMERSLSVTYYVDCITHVINTNISFRTRKLKLVGLHHVTMVISHI